MSRSDLIKINMYLYIIECELDKIAKLTNHPLFEEFTRGNGNE